MTIKEPFVSNENQSIGPGLLTTFLWMSLILAAIDLGATLIASYFDIPMWPQ